MGRRSFTDTDLRGGVIDSRAKETKSREVDGDGRFCGHRFILKTKLFGDKRCMVCGRWFHWTEWDVVKAEAQDALDTTNNDNVREPVHCGSEHCTEWWRQSQEAAAKRALDTFMKLSRLGIVV